jgi:hypothetical protein
MSSPSAVAGHELPAALFERVVRGSWPPAATTATLIQVFGEQPEPSAKLYSIDEMEGETSRWQHETDPAYLGIGEETLDPACSILIGDLGFDRPIGLDLRWSPAPVRLLTIDGRWRVIFNSIDELLMELVSIGG